MGRIWDSPRAVERQASVSSKRRVERVADRRCGPRLWTYAPMFVYGRTTVDEPFYEPTQALRVSASGGLITLRTPMVSGQPLVLINELNHREQKCHLVGHRGSYLDRSAVGIEFSEAAPDFWETRR
jgi:hypothetical protein